MNLTRPLTPAQARLIRIHVALIPVYGWLILAWTMYAFDISVPGRLDRSGHVKGHDFAHFYVLGQIANERAAGDLYSFTAQAKRMDALVPHYENRFAPIHGPQMSVLFAPLARLPYETAVAVWLLLTAAGYALCWFLLWSASSSLHSYGWLATILAIGYPAFYLLIAFGQNSVIGLGCVTGAYLALKAGRPWLAGFALGSLVYKPVFGFALPFVLLYGREWQMIVGAVTGMALQLGVGALYFGAGSLVEYFRSMRHVGEIAGVLEPIPYQMQSLRSFFSVLVPSASVAYAAYFLTAVLVIVLAARCWRSAVALEVRYSVLLLATVLVNPHVNPYDLVVIVPVFVLVAQWSLTSGRTGGLLWVVLFLCYYLPAMTFLPAMTHVQFSVLAMVVLMVMLTTARTAGRRASSVPA
jgi:alpha-1,2-mannosyltransferase